MINQKYLKTFLFCLGAWIFFFILGAFVQVSFNPAEWSEPARALVASMCFFSTLVTIIVRQ